MKVKCGDANPNGNISLTYKGGCGKELDIKNAYRCGGCGGWFHKDCLYKHFELEKEHDYGRVQGYKEGWCDCCKELCAQEGLTPDCDNLEFCDKWNNETI